MAEEFFKQKCDYPMKVLFKCNQPLDLYEQKFK